MNTKLFEKIYKMSCDMKRKSLRESSKKPSKVLTRKNSSTKRSNYYSDGYYQDDSYYEMNGTGYIMDKNNNSYDVKIREYASDSGRIAGGTMNYSVIIYYNDDKLRFKGYSAIFSHGSGTNIIPDIENGYYLEDFCAKHIHDSDFDCRDIIVDLAKDGDEKAISYNQNRLDHAKERELKANELKNNGPKVDSEFDLSEGIEGKVICFTGKIDDTPRSQLEELVVQAGGIFSPTLTRSCDYLVMADPNSTSNKVIAARKNGTKIISPKEFFKLLPN